MGTFSELNAIPEFAAQWKPVAAQLGLEGASELAVNTASDMMAQSYTDMASQLGVNPSDAVQYAKEFTMGAQTVAGCVSTAQGLIAAAQGASSPAQIVAVGNMFAGTLIAAAGAAGLCSMGVGSVVVAAVGIALDIMSKLGLFGSDAPSWTVCGTKLSSQPSIVVGCAFTQAAKNTIGAADWRRFPDPKTDPSWFAAPKQVAFTSFALATLQGTQWMGAFSDSPKRLIDSAFPNYAAIVGQQPKAADASALANFMRAFFVAWKAAHEHELNGLVAPEDVEILVHTVRIWNRAHAAAPYHDLATGDPSLPYAASLMALAGQRYKADDPASNMVAGRLRIHTGSPVTFVVHPAAVHVAALTLHKISAPAPVKAAAPTKAPAPAPVAAAASATKTKLAIGAFVVAGLAIASKFL